MASRSWTRSPRTLSGPPTKTFHHVRRTIVDLLGLASEVSDELNEIKPKDMQSMRKVVRGRLIGAIEDPAMEGELYPRFEWSSGIDSVVREGSTFQVKPKDRMTVRMHPDVGFRLERLAAAALGCRWLESV
jgi:hypothetical protein